MKPDETFVVEILTTHPPSDSAWDDPINAVAKATGLTTIEARQFVEDLRDRKIVAPFSIVGDGPQHSAKYHWKRPPEKPRQQKKEGRDANK